MFLAANIDEKLVGEKLSINQESCTKFASSKEGIKNMSKTLCKMMSKMSEQPHIFYIFDIDGVKNVCYNFFAKGD